MHRHDIHRRLAALEARHHTGTPKFNVWINKGDGLLRNRDGAAMTQEAFDAAFPNAIKFTLNIGGISSRDALSQAFIFRARCMGMGVVKSLGIFKRGTASGVIGQSKEISRHGLGQQPPGDSRYEE
jgi:hypothetical protein